MRSSSVLILKEQDVTELVNARDAIDALEGMLVAMEPPQVVNIPRRRASIPAFTLHSMSAVDSRLGRGAWKQYTTTPQGARFHVGLYDVASGALLALIQADRLGQLRTGAISAVAARQLAPQSGIGRVALIGCGWQAQSQLECLTEVCPANSIKVFCRDADKRREFAHTMSQRLGLHVEAAQTAESCVRDAQTLVTMTSARQPVVEAGWLAHCRLIIAAGSNQPRNSELPASLVNHATRIVVDDIEGCQNEAGDLIMAASQLVRAETLWERVESLASVISNKTAPQLRAWHNLDEPDTSGPVLFKSVGMAASDLALASLVYDRACQKGAGSRIEL